MINMGFLTSLFKESTKEIRVICDLELSKYLGRWYEIARLPHSFESGLDNVTATYELMKDGKIRVINSGYKDGIKKEAVGKAWVPDKSCSGKLLVSFFWIFKSEYKVIELDKATYQYVMITSSTKNYLWILCRQPELDAERYQSLVEKAASYGFDCSKLIKVIQNR
jgi:apolipoprotein D and lipocalin family protein